MACIRVYKLELDGATGSLSVTANARANVAASLRASWPLVVPLAQAPDSHSPLCNRKTTAVAATGTGTMNLL